MTDADTTRQLQVLQRQYFQLVEPQNLRWPEDILKQSDVQAWMFREMFDAESIKSPPPDRYQLRVLKMLISKLERAIENPEEDVRLPISSQRAISQLNLNYYTKQNAICFCNPRDHEFELQLTLRSIGTGNIG